MFDAGDLPLPPAPTSLAPQVSTGVDLVEVDRIAGTLARFGERFLQRIYTPAELAIIGRNPVRLAGRFAAKEACAKALGTGIDGPRWREVECLRDAIGKPVLHLHGLAAARALQLGWQSLDISISTTHRFAVAVVVALGAPAEPHA